MEKTEKQLKYRSFPFSSELFTPLNSEDSKTSLVVIRTPPACLLSGLTLHRETTRGEWNLNSWNYQDHRLPTLELNPSMGCVELCGPHPKFSSFSSDVEFSRKRTKIHPMS